MKYKKSCNKGPINTGWPPGFFVTRDWREDSEGDDPWVTAPFVRSPTSPKNYDFVGIISQSTYARDQYPDISYRLWWSSKIHRTLVSFETLVLQICALRLMVKEVWKPIPQPKLLLVPIKKTHATVAFPGGRPPVAHLGSVIALACRNLPDCLLQLCHQHFIVDQEGLPGRWHNTTQHQLLQASTEKKHHFLSSRREETSMRWSELYLLSVGHDEELPSFEAPTSGIPSSTISFTAFKVSSVCSR